MPLIKPFKGIHFNPSKIDNMSDVVTPPYDNIPESEVPLYLKRSPYNYAHVILPRDEEVPYTHASQLLTKWREHQILVEDPSPGFYSYQQKFQVDGKNHVRHSLMAVVQLSEFSKGQVRPHEITHDHHRKDRLEILRKTRCNLSHIFAMVKDSDGHLKKLFEKASFGNPILEAKTQADGVEHVIWRIDPNDATVATQFMENTPLYILDGHHRYGSALAYAQERKVEGTDSPEAFLLFSISSCYDEGLMVLPTHRELKGPLPQPFPWEAFEKAFTHEPADVTALERLVQKPATRPEFLLWIEGKLRMVHPKNAKPSEGQGEAISRFSVLWSDDRFLGDIVGVKSQERSERVAYHKSWRTLWDKRENVSCGIFHAPPSIEHMTEIADEGSFMPQKSTFFFPKLAAGLVLRDLDSLLG